MYIYIYTYTYIYAYMYIYTSIYIYIHRHFISGAKACQRFSCIFPRHITSNILYIPSVLKQCKSFGNLKSALSDMWVVVQLSIWHWLCADWVRTHTLQAQVHTRIMPVPKAAVQIQTTMMLPIQWPFRLFLCGTAQPNVTGSR